MQTSQYSNQAMACMTSKSGFNSQWGQRFFSLPLHPDKIWSPPRILSKGLQEIFPQVKSYQAMKLTGHLHLVPKVKTAAIPAQDQGLLQWAVVPIIYLCCGKHMLDLFVVSNIQKFFFRILLVISIITMQISASRMVCFSCYSVVGCQSDSDPPNNSLMHVMSRKLQNQLSHSGYILNYQVNASAKNTAYFYSSSLLKALYVQLQDCIMYYGFNA